MNLQTVNLEFRQVTRFSRSSSEEIREQTDQALRKTGYLALRNVEITVHEGLATLRGQVSTYHLKQVAQSVAMTIEGIEGIENQIVVCRTMTRHDLSD